MKKNSVIPANPYDPSAMGSLNQASYMLLRQHKFPLEYREDEELLTVWSDQPTQYDLTYFSKSFGGSDRTFEFWLRNEDYKRILIFLCRIMRADEKIVWTGFRVLATIIGNGQVLFTWQLFSKQHNSRTKVYTKEDEARNVIFNR